MDGASHRSSAEKVAHAPRLAEAFRQLDDEDASLDAHASDNSNASKQTEAVIVLERRGFPEMVRRAWRVVPPPIENVRWSCGAGPAQVMVELSSRGKPRIDT